MNHSFWAHVRQNRSGAAAQPETVDTILPMVLGGESIAPSIVDTGSSTISRVHETRVEIDADVSMRIWTISVADDRITDVVIISPTMPSTPVSNPQDHSWAGKEPPCECRAAAQPEVQL
jgi:hypothetical protein